MAIVKVKVPNKLTFAIDDVIYRPGDTFEAERADVESYLSIGHLELVAPATKKKAKPTE
ncbi:MAG: hypothetical protein M3P43_16845 [Actinomycetota bacterium]|nr:hypothetical protein [Actinomycetota bacterium]